MSLMSSGLAVGCGRRQKSVAGLLLPKLGGGDIKLDDWIGKPFLINYWASNCVTCMHEMPQLVSLYSQWKDYGFNLLSVAVPWDRPDLVKGVVAHYELPFPVTHDREGVSLALVEQFKGTPTNLLIDPQGYVAEVILGMPDFGEVAQQLGKWLKVGVENQA